MHLPGANNWLKSPQDRKIIAAWTVGRGEGMTYALEFPPPADPERFSFLALGDSGDSEASGPHVSPQDAVAREMAWDAALPGSAGSAALVLHMGDVVYMTGERRLYNRNFRQPYAPFLAPQSTVDSMIFRLPFLPVPGNHDYYDLKGWTRWLARVPLLGAGVRAIAHELFAFSLPSGGSEMGKAYMEAFVDPTADTRLQALPYHPGERTQLPNRYYRFRIGNTDFFALDSNTLDAPAPWKEAAHQQVEATRRIHDLETRAQELDGELTRHQLVLERWRDAAKHEVVHDTDRQANISEIGADVGSALAELRMAIAPVLQEQQPCGEGAQAIEKAISRWTVTADDFASATEPAPLLAALQAMDSASDECCAALGAVEGCLAELPEGPDRARILTARDSLQTLLHRWSQAVATAPLETSQRIHQLSEEALDIQRELALERRRLHYGPEDFDGAQRQWLEKSLTEAIRERPDGWRIVYLHHPLYTTISNHCERPDVQGLRENLLALFQGRVHLILSGHAHAFEWFRSEALPDTGIFVTGGGGQVALRPTLLEPARLQRSRHRYEALRANGVQECAIAGRGPMASDGEAGSLYHYLHIEVTPDVLTVRPVGIRRLAGGYRREEPMPVYHVPELPELRPALNPRYLKAVEILRNQPPQPRWL